MQGQSYKKSTHPAKDEWRKIRVSYILTFGTFWPFCAILSRYLLIHNRLPQTALPIVEGLEFSSGEGISNYIPFLSLANSLAIRSFHAFISSISPS